MPKPRLESTTNAQIHSSAPQNSLLGFESIFNGQMSTNSSDDLTAHFSALYGTTASSTTTRTPSTAPLHVLPNSPDTASLYLPSPLSSQSQASICLCAAPCSAKLTLRSAHSPSSPRNLAKLRSPQIQTHGLLKLDLVISYSVALLFDSVSCRVLLSCRCPPT